MPAIAISAIGSAAGNGMMPLGPGNPPANGLGGSPIVGTNSNQLAMYGALPAE